MRCFMLVGTLCTFGGYAPVASAQPDLDGLWKPAEIGAITRLVQPIDGVRGWNRSGPTRYFQLDTKKLTEVIDRAAFEQIGLLNIAPRRALNEISLPMPDGSLPRFTFEQTQLMAPGLAAKYPKIRTFRGRSTDNPQITARFEVTAKGLSAQVTTPQQTIVVDPAGNEGLHGSLAKRDAHRESRFQCLVETGQPAARRGGEAARPITSGTVVRTYRLAVACTREYASFHSQGVAAADVVEHVLAAITRTMNRVDSIYERELCVRLQLVSNNDKLIFTSATAAQQYPFSTNSDPFALINESQSVIDQVIGNANYDVGHTLSTGAGGLAGLGVACRTGQKARGVTGSASPIDDPFDVDYVAHELGHQFGGNHCFNGSHNNCNSSTWHGPTACEPGSGTTIQAYAGICAVDNVANNSDDYFHSVSLDEMITYTTTGAGSAVAAVANSNNPPKVKTGGNFVIPRETPFALTATGSDPDGDPILYCWEQRDLGPRAGLDAVDDGQIPLFRSYRPIDANARVFPRMTDLVTGAFGSHEKLPKLNRTMNFRVTARDGRGGINGDDCTIRVEAAAGPFQVLTMPPTAQSGLIDVRWSVANTNVAPVDAQRVDILLSTDGGVTFATALAIDVPNDGLHQVTLPNLSTAAARIMIRSVGNVFFAISPSNFSIAPHGGSLLITAPPGGRGTDDEFKRLRSKAQIDRILQVNDDQSLTQAIRAAESNRGSLAIVASEAQISRLMQLMQVPASRGTPGPLVVTRPPTAAAPSSPSTSEPPLVARGAPSPTAPMRQGEPPPNRFPDIERKLVEFDKRIAALEPKARSADRAATRHIVFVHGICKHEAGYSDPWWAAMKPFVPSIPDTNRHEVLWSDLVNAARAARGDPKHETQRAAIRNDFSERVRETLKDRDRRQRVAAAGGAAGIEPEATRGAVDRLGGLDCIDDFARYMSDEDVRTAVLKRFLDVIRPLLVAGHQVEIVSHSWGSVVAYEGMRALDAEAHPGNIHSLFTVGSALSIGEVQRNLLPANKDGRRPVFVKLWINLDAKFDIVGGSIKNDPFAVDEEFLQLQPIGCGSFIPNPVCAHSSYFNTANIPVARDIFGRTIER